MFSELVRNAEHLLHRQAAEAIRRQKWLTRQVDDSDHQESVPASNVVDHHGLDLEVFKNKTGRRPKDWHKACQIASWVCIDEMRKLLELHYDAVHYKRWRKDQIGNPNRKSDFKIYNAVAQNYRNKLHQNLELPKPVQDILQGPKDEDSYTKLNQLRKEIVDCVQGKDCFHVESPEMAAAIKKAIEECPRVRFVDEVGAGCSCIPEGCRLIVDAVDKKGVLQYLDGLSDEWIYIYRYPFGTPRQPFVSDLFEDLRDAESMEELATEKEWAKEELVDNLLLILFDALWLAQSESWTSRGVANTPQDEAFELARWFMKGQSVADKPIFDGICAQCGALLYGEMKSSTVTNKKAGPPCDRDGKILMHEGVPQTDAQPPFVLRFSPKVFAEEAPAMFHYDPETNRLSIVEGMQAPWLRGESRAGDAHKATWLYCVDCHDRYFGTGKGQGHIPFRDKARLKHKSVKLYLLLL